jgi:hypothetical protein
MVTKMEVFINQIAQSGYKNLHISPVPAIKRSGLNFIPCGMKAKPCGMEVKASGMNSIPHSFYQNAHGLNAIPCGMKQKASGMEFIPHHFMTK